MKISRRSLGLAGAFVASLVFLAGCPAESGDSVDRVASDQASLRFSRNQPMHSYDFTQARQNMLAAQDALALGSNSFTVQMMPGIGRTFECPSVGFPLPFGTQLTNPEKAINGSITLPQIEPYGLFPPADVAATLANCILPNGQIGIFYSEPDLTTFMFDVRYNPETKMYEIPPNSTSKITIKRLEPSKVDPREEFDAGKDDRTKCPKVS